MHLIDGFLLGRRRTPVVGSTGHHAVQIHVCALRCNRCRALSLRTCSVFDDDSGRSSLSARALPTPSTLLLSRAISAHRHKAGEPELTSLNHTSTGFFGSCSASSSKSVRDTSSFNKRLLDTRSQARRTADSSPDVLSIENTPAVKLPLTSCQPDPDGAVFQT